MSNEARRKILAVDDDPTVLNILAALGAKYDLTLLPSVELAMKFLQTNKIDLIISDYYMEQATGFDFYDLVRQSELNPKAPFIFLTGATEDDIEVMALEKGAMEFIAKPIKLPLLFARVETALKIISYVGGLEKVIEERTDKINQAHATLMKTHNSIFSLLANAVYVRDEGTGTHIKNTNRFVTIIVGELLRRGKLTETEAGDIIKSSSLHDIGKIAIKDDILLKPGPLTREEFEIIKTHSAIGGEILKKYIDRDGAMSFLTCAYEIALYHHEKFDGSGYPCGLKGRDIPLSARIMAIVDVYDALISDRVYKARLCHSDAAGIIKKGSGSHFDPELVDIFFENEARFMEIQTDARSD